MLPRHVCPAGGRERRPACRIPDEMSVSVVHKARHLEAPHLQASLDGAEMHARIPLKEMLAKPVSLLSCRTLRKAPQCLSLPVHCLSLPGSHPPPSLQRGTHRSHAASRSEVVRQPICIRLDAMGRRNRSQWALRWTTVSRENRARRLSHLRCGQSFTRVRRERVRPCSRHSRPRRTIGSLWTESRQTTQT